MPSAPNIKKVPFKELRSKLLRPALTSHFICEFFIPENGRTFFENRLNLAEIPDRLNLGCSDAALPGSSLTTNDISDDYTGVSEKHAYRRLYDDSASFTFYVDADEYYVIRFFETWIGYTMNEQYGGTQNISSQTYFYRAQWPNNYTVDTLKISKFERDYELGETGVLNPIPKKFLPRALEYNFVKAFPISIASMPVSYEQSQLLKCTVTFTYSRYWLRNLIGKGNGTQPNPGAPGASELNKAQPAPAPAPAPAPESAPESAPQPTLGESNNSPTGPGPSPTREEPLW